jgi:hypothetical protein
MPAIKCPSCGHRHFQPVAQCMNCGEPLAALYSSPVPDEDVSIREASSPNVDENDEELAAYQRFLAESRQEENSRLRISATKSSARSLPDPSAHKPKGKGLRIRETQQPEHASHTPSPDTPQAGEGAAARQLIVRPGDQLVNQDWRPQHAIQPYEIYETALDIIPPETFSALPGVHAGRNGQEPLVDPELWKTDKLPWYFPRTRPNLAGTVILMETKEEIIDYPDLSAAIATLLVELVWVFAQVQQEKESGDRVVMTTVRVRTYDGALKDSRVRGNMRGANISLGDEVSLWGAKRNGVLFVRHGFNHTTQGVISTHSLGLIVPALIVIVAFIALFYLLPSWLPSTSHQFLSALEVFFNFWSKHPLTTPMPKN